MSSYDFQEHLDAYSTVPHQQPIFKRRMTFSLDPEIDFELRKFAKSRGISISAAVNLAVTKMLKEGA